MKKLFKFLSPIIITLLLSFGVAQAVTIFQVQQGGTGVGTITGLIQGNGTSPFTAVTIGSGLQLSSGTLSATNSGTVTSVSGTANRITSTGGATPVIDISASYVGQSSITTLGTITTGVWNGTAIANANLANSTISGIALGSNLNALTATDTSLTFSGSYNGSTARTVGLNVGNANTWTGKQTFNTSAPRFGTITGSTQCLHVDTNGDLTGTGSDCGAGSGGLTVGTTTIASGTTGRVLYDNAGILGEMTNTGTGTVNVLQTSPSLITPALGVPTSGDFSTGTFTWPTFNQNTTGSAAKWTTARNLAGNSVDGSANVAFANKFIVQGTSDAGLSGAQFLGALGTGLVKNTTTTGVLSIASAGTDYEVPLTFSTGLTRSTNTITVNTSQNISTLSNLTSNGLVTTSGGTGALSITAMGTGIATFLGTPSSANLATAVTDETGSGLLVFGTSPTLTTPVLGAATYTTLSGGNITDSGLTSGRVTFASTGGLLVDDADMTFATDTLTVTKIAATTFTGNITLSTKNIVTDTTTGTQIGTGSTQKLGFFGATPVVQQTGNAVTALSNLGLVKSATWPVASISGLGTNVGTWLATPSSANLAAAITDETGTGLAVFGTAPTFASTMTIGTASGTTGKIDFKGTTSGTVSLTVAAAAGTTTFTLPTSGGSSGQFLQTDGTGVMSWASATGTAFPVQDVAIATGTTATTGGSGYYISSAPDGSAIYIGVDLGGSGTANLYMLKRDTTTSNYYLSASTSFSTATSNGIRGICATNSNVFVTASISGTLSLRRFSLTDLSGITSMTFSGTSRASQCFGGTNNDLYIQNGSTDQYDKFTISGTTATNAGAITYTSSATTVGGISNGTNVWIPDGTSGAFNIRKYPIAGGSATTTTAVNIPIGAWTNASANSNTFMANTSLGIGWAYNIVNPSNNQGAALHLMAITP